MRHGEDTVWYNHSCFVMFFEDSQSLQVCYQNSKVCHDYTTQYLHRVSWNLLVESVTVTTISYCPSALYHCLKRIISCPDSAAHIHLAIFLHVSLVPFLFYSGILKACDFISFHLDKILLLDTVEDISSLYQCLMF